MYPQSPQSAGVPPGLGGAVAFVVGACVGSFLNVVIRRFPTGESIVRPGSHCACGRPIAWRDKLPVLSWLLLRGRARCCGRPISPRYPAVELLTAALFLASWELHAPAVAACGCLFLGLLVCASFIDLDQLVIPDALSLGLSAAGLALSVFAPALHGERSGYFALDSLRSGADALLGLLVGSGIVLWIALIGDLFLKKESMGFGDVKFAGGIGAFCGWRGAVFAVFGGALVGTAWLAILLACGKAAANARKAPGPGGPATENGEEPSSPFAPGARLPFGPMLAVAAALYFLLLHRWVDRWFSEVASLF
jgi:leader peptidase (prepilin peptidase)/N-methyltransferase